MKFKPLKVRGVRLSDCQWKAVCKEAAKDKTGRTRPSDIIRRAIDYFFENKG